MKFYLCGPTAMTDEIESYRRDLESRGHIVTSRWHSGTIGSPRIELDNPILLQRAIDDLYDIDAADALITFSGKPGRGGRHYEAGYAAGSGKTVFLVGDMEHVFHSLYYTPETQFDNWDECLERIERLS